MRKILVIGDTHFPYSSDKSINEVIRFARKERPDTVVQCGDLLDQYSFSRFTRKNIDLPDEELRIGREKAAAMWSGISGACRLSDKYQLLGNHDSRLIKRAEEKLPEAQTLVREKVMELYQFKGVTTLEDDRSELKIHGITFHHGYLSRLGDHMRYFGTNAVVGHSHVGGVVYEQRHGRTLWELNAGYLADEKAEPLRYKPVTTSKWTLGFGLITFRGKVPCPAFIPL